MNLPARTAVAMPMRSEAPTASSGMPSSSDDPWRPDLGEGGDAGESTPLPSFDELAATGSGGAIDAELRERFEAAHGVDLGGVRVSQVPLLAEHGLRGVARGAEILVAESGDREAIEHELGHVVDVAQHGPAAANASVGDLALAEDPAREARADALAAAARTATPKPRDAAAPRPAAPRPDAPRDGGAAQPRLTNRSAISRGSNGNFVWSPHKTKATPAIGGGATSEGLGAVLSTDVKLASTATSEHGQLKKLTHTIIPVYVDSTRPDLPEPPATFHGLKGAYVVPAAILGQPIASNLLYLPSAALTQLAQLQDDVTDLAFNAPGRMSVETRFGKDGFADEVDVKYEVLDRVTQAAVATTLWTITPAKDRSTWDLDVANAPQSIGKAPDSPEWKTEVTWGKPHVPTGDGTHVVADKLGPDHTLGSSPSNTLAANRVAELETAASPGKGKGETYIAGHLLNDNLGGPGDLALNLAPIPGKANSQMSKNIEEPTKTIVNKQRGWVRYEVQVTHAYDNVAKVHYPSQLDAWLSIYDRMGVAQLAQQSTIAIDAPSKFANKTAKAPNATAKFGGNAIESSPQMLDEVVLSQENDLRPFMRGSEDLFKLVFGSDLNASVQSPEIATSWMQILDLWEGYNQVALPTLNLLKTLTDAMKVWGSDPIAQDYLGKTSAAELREHLKKFRGHAVNFCTLAEPMLQQATAAVKTRLHPADLFHSTEMIDFAEQLVQHEPDDVTLLEVMKSRQAVSIPRRSRTLDQARSSSDVVVEQRETEVRDDYRSQKREKPTPSVSSPVHVFQEYGTSTKDLDTVGRFGIAYESARGKKAVAALFQAVEDYDHGDATIRTLQKLPELQKSVRLQAVLTQAAHAHLMQQGTLSGMNGELLLSFKPLWQDAFDRAGTDEPEAALALFTALGIV